MGDSALLKKLRISTEQSGIVVNAPAEYQSLSDALLTGTTEPGRALDFGLLFVNSDADLHRHFPDFSSCIKFDGVIWVAYPKKSSGVVTDINRDTGWEIVFRAGFKPVTQISLNETWSALRFRPGERVGK